MKKFFALLMIFAMLFSFTSCTNGSDEQSTVFVIPQEEGAEQPDSSAQVSEEASEEIENDTSGEDSTEVSSSHAQSSHSSSTTQQTGNQSSSGSATNNDSPLISSQHDYFETASFSDPNTGVPVQYLFHKPVRSTGKKYPLIIFLHGLGGTVDEWNMGTATELVNSLIYLENESDKYSAYTLIPQTPLAGEGWWTDGQLTAFKKLIYDLVDNHNVDPKRIYITGISMGGFTTCQLVDEMPPNTFAAAVPLSGSSNMTDPQALYNTAFRIYHSRNDTIVNVSCSRSLYNQLTAAGHPNVEYTEFETGDHTSPLTDVFFSLYPSFYDWLFSQRLP